MSRPAAALNPGQTNRRFIMLAVVLGLLGAVLVYAAFSRQGGSGSGGGNQIPVVVAKTDIPARSKVTASMVEVKLVAQGDASSLAYKDTTEVIGQLTRFPITANEQVLSNKIVALEGTASVASKSLSFVVPPGKRAMAVTVTQVVAAGGLVLPGDYVDVLVVFDVDFPSDPKDPTQREKAEAYYIETMFQSIEVLAVSQTIVDVVEKTGAGATESTTPPGTQRVRNTEAKPDAEAITVTLALTPEQAQKLYLAEENGRIRLSVRPYGDTEERPIDPMNETEFFRRSLPNPFIR